MFTIPNTADAENVTQATVDARDFADILAPATNGVGVMNGCAVTPQGSPNMTVAVAAGKIAIQTSGPQLVYVPVAGGNVTITAAHATLARFDLICVDSGGAKSAVAGTPATNPIFPDPAGKVVLAAVRVPAAATSINAAKITDKRVFSASSAFTYYDFTPALGSTSPPNIGTAGTQHGRAIRVGNFCHARFQIYIAGTGITNGSGSYTIPFPFTSITNPQVNSAMVVGQGVAYFATANLWYPMVCEWVSIATFVMRVPNWSSLGQSVVLAGGTPAALTAGSFFCGNLHYEVA